MAEDLDRFYNLIVGHGYKRGGNASLEFTGMAGAPCKLETACSLDSFIQVKNQVCGCSPRNKNKSKWKTDLEFAKPKNRTLLPVVSNCIILYRTINLLDLVFLFENSDY